MRNLLESLGFRQIGKIAEERIAYQNDAEALAGSGNAVYLFLNSDDTVWKVGMTAQWLQPGRLHTSVRRPSDEAPK